MLVLDVFSNDVELSVQEQQSRALKLQKKNNTNCSSLQNIIKSKMDTNSRRHASPFEVFLYSFQALFMLLNCYAFSFLIILPISTGELQSRAQTLADTLYEGCVLKFNWDSPSTIMRISSILSTAAPLFFKHFTPQLTVFVIVRNLSLCHLWKLSSAIWHILVDFLTVHY